MSLGFLTESALLPSKSKKIEVDGRSQLPLKAIVAEELSKREAAAEGKGGAGVGGGGGGGATEGLRKARGRKRVLEDGGRRDVYGGQNKGVAERNRRDAERDKLENPRERHKRSEQMLKRKAEDYERILRGEEELPDESDEDNLVDFARKREQLKKAAAAAKDADTGGDGGAGKKRAKRGEEEEKEGAQQGEKLPKGFAEMVDEFGRTRVVSKQSEEYKAYKAERDAQRRHDAFFGNKQREREGPSYARPAAAAAAAAAAAGPTTAAASSSSSSSHYGPGGQQQPHRGEAGGGGQQWAWSRGEAEAEARAQAKEEKRQRKREEAERWREREERSSAVQEGAIRTQWERRLESQAQGFLAQVISEQAAGGAEKGPAEDAQAQRQREKEERRKKLLAKLQGQGPQG